MKPFIVLAAAVLLASPVLAQTPASASTSASKAHKLDRAAVDALLATPDKVLVLDVRRPDELSSKGGFPVYLSIQAADLEKELPFIPRDRTILTVSNHAARASKAADLLVNHGFQVAGAVGVDDYVAQGGTILKVPVPPAATAAAGPAVH